MVKNKVIPEGYMTVGQLAKRMGTTVRTLQFYDREGLLCPSSESEGGRRLYTCKDMIKLHQILSLKSLGFSLDDIKNRLIPLDTPSDVAEVLLGQAAAIKEKIESLTESLKSIEKLRAEVLQMQSVDFGKYADIIVNLQMNNDAYWLIKYFDDKTLDHIRNKFDIDSGREMMDRFMNLRDEAVDLEKNGVPPENEKAQNLAKSFWEMIMEFTGGDMNMISSLSKMGRFEESDNEQKQMQLTANGYIEAALDIYFTNLGVNPFEEVENE